MRRIEVNYKLVNFEDFDLVHENENIEYKDSIDMYSILSSTTHRKTLIDNLVNEALQYGIDGINVDFEQISLDCGEHYIEFIRELSIPCRANGIVLSVDNYVPSDYTAFYNRAEQALFADYVVIMAYDEHYAGSTEAGSVASIGFVTDGVENTLKEVPADQVILGMPFYTRVWSETPIESDSTATDETDVAVDYTLSSYATNMTEVQKLISANGAQPVWLDDIGQNYVEYQNGGVNYKIWIEDATSLEKKLTVMDTYNLAGGSFWKLGMEDSSIWDTIIKYIN